MTKSIQAYEVVQYLQNYFVDNLNKISTEFGDSKHFKPISWLREGGKYGGGTRFVAEDDIFNRASVNVSGIHYDKNDNKTLLSADAISSIIHPANPYAPSIHIHFSYTGKKDNSGYFRLMGDLNPSIANDEFKNEFTKMLKNKSKEFYEKGSLNGDKYFYIPVLKRTRGVKHFYLENFNSNSFEHDLEFVKNLAKAIIDTYTSILTKALINHTNYDERAKQIQLDYHTLYFLQVLTLDRGTTSGLLVHNENDIGIMGSIPSHINVALLTSWLKKMPSPQDKLLQLLINALSNTNTNTDTDNNESQNIKIALVDTDTKAKLANVVREHYKKYPQALNMQASGDVIPATLKNHL